MTQRATRRVTLATLTRDPLSRDFVAGVTSVLAAHALTKPQVKSIVVHLSCNVMNRSLEARHWKHLADQMLE